MRKHKRLMTLAMAALSLQFLASCFTYKKETVSPEPAVVTVPAPTTTSQTTTSTTSTDGGSSQRTSTTNY